MNKQIKLFTNGNLEVNGRKFTRMCGGFGNDKPMFLLWNAGELLNQETNLVTKNFNNNISKFEEGVDYIDLKSLPNDFRKTEIVDMTTFFKSVGISHNKYGRANQWLAFSFSGMMKLVKIASTDEAWNIYENFLEDYFMTKVENKKMKSTLQEELDFLEEERAMLYGKLITLSDDDKRVETAQKLEQLNNRKSKIISAIDNQEIDIALQKQSRLSESKEKYNSLAELGDKFNCKIGAKCMGKLLIITKICKRNSKKKTVPYQHNTPKFAMTDLETQSHVYNYNECIKIIDNWLNDNGFYERFYSITNSETMEIFIRNLYKRFRDGEFEDEE